tara:strand:+ start:2714 stop:3070 length:357 start_codon:yes stop_codon:yes gene_type:complete
MSAHDDYLDPDRYLGNDTELNEDDVYDIASFLELRNLDEATFDQIKRNTYKFTDCGAWVSEDEHGIDVGSIVEGVDEGTPTHSLKYPFPIKKFWEELQAVEDEADQIWKFAAFATGRE